MQNLVGEKFNKLTVIEFSHKAPGGIYWKCECECGNTNTVTQSALKRGATKSCGCSRKKEKSESLQKLYTRTWRSWEMMHLQGPIEDRTSISIDIERMEAARNMPRHSIPQGLGIEQIREHILAAAKRAEGNLKHHQG